MADAANSWLHHPLVSVDSQQGSLRRAPSHLRPPTSQQARSSAGRSLQELEAGLASKWCRSANQRRRAAENLVVGQKVWLLRRHITTTRPSTKLDVRRLGPFEILEQIGSSAFRLKLPSAIKIHPVFHVSLLEPHVANPFSDRVVDPLPALQVDGVEEFEVHEILHSRFRRGQLQYYVDWVGYDVSDCSWEPARNVGHATEALCNFHQKFPSRPRPHVSSFEGGVLLGPTLFIY